uniref:Uncharacterized protein n=1 Tax=Timema bartmani TaxID=61472 RepID=A0A7R9I1T8_9NEOP|nr:unnamed protein product [Timema bartmani]
MLAKMVPDSAGRRYHMTTWNTATDHSLINTALELSITEVGGINQGPFESANPARVALCCSALNISLSVLVGFEPNATMETAHHMLLYGCTAPGSKKAVW